MWGLLKFHKRIADDGDLAPQKGFPVTTELEELLIRFPHS
jgi:hypothetical protein